MARILAVIVNYRTARMTLRAARCAIEALHDLDAQLVIVDNASGDGSDLVLAQALQTEDWALDAPVRLLLADRNGGFGAGNNIAIRAGRSDGQPVDYVYLLNSDAFPAPDAVRVLVDHMAAHPEVGMAGSFLTGDDGAEHVSAFRFPTVLSELEGAARTGPVTRLLRRHVIAPGVPAATGPVDWLAGASLMLRASMLDRIGLFDETFFLYFEETDLCRRAAAAGYARHFVRESRVTHIGSVSTGMKRRGRVPRYWFASRWHYFRKTHGVTRACAATLAHVAGGLVWRLRRSLRRGAHGDPPYFLRDLLAHDLRAVLTSPARGADACAAHPARQE